MPERNQHDPAPQVGQTPQGFRFEGDQLRYLLFLPEDYYQSPEIPRPLMLFLHGAGERGDDLSILTRHGIPKIVGKRKDFPFVVLSPQCPRTGYWRSEPLKTLVDDAIGRLRVDDRRIYGTGISMGGFGIWRLAMDYPDLFAAIAPICGGGEPERACRIAHLPVWAFHGDADRIVPPEESGQMVEALKECGGNVRFTLYPGVGHDSWTETYGNEKLYEWFLQHERVKMQD